MDNGKDNIKEILKSAGEEYKAADVTETHSDVGLEFEFHSESVGGFVFERVESIVLPEKEEPTPAPETEAPREPEEEFTIPESFSVDSEYDTPIKEEEPPRIWTTYVPRFTEVTENYRMARTMSAQPSRKSPEREEPAPDIDPIEEIDENVETESDVIVTPPKQEDLPGESMSVYKFKTEAEPESETEAESPREAEPVTSQNAEPEEPIIFETEAEEAPVPKKTPEFESKKETKRPGGLSNYYSIPFENEPDEPEEDPDLESYDGKLKNGEYTSFARRDSFKDKFLDTLISVRVRFFFALVLTVLAAVFENISLFGVNIAEPFSLAGISWALPLIDMQLVIWPLVLAIPELMAGIKALCRGKLMPELFLPVSALFYIIYCAVMMAITPAKYPMFALAFAISALMAIGSSYLGTSANFSAFKSVSDNGEKKVIDNKYTRTLEKENISLDGMVEEHKSKTARVFRTLFVSDFFARATKRVENRFNITVGLAIGVGAGIVSAIISFFLYDGAVSALSALALVPLLSFPAFSYILAWLPYSHAQKEAAKENSALIGVCAPDEYQDTNVVTFDDTEVFGPEDVSLKQVMLYGSADNISKPLRQMAALFSVAGGPLDVIFSNAVERRCPPAMHTVIEHDGISGYVDGAHVLAGTREYMVRCGVYIPDEPSGSYTSAQHSTRTMYAAEEGKVYAKFSIRYSFSENFTMLLPVLRDEGIVPLIYTRDPNINLDLAMTLTAGADVIRVMKKTSPASSDGKIYSRASAGIVTKGDKNNAINMILLVKRHMRLRSRLSAMELVVMSVSAALAALLALCNMTAISSLVMGAWQLLWCAVLYVLSRSTFSIRKPKKEEENEGE